MVLPIMIYFVLFKYLPMYGTMIAFKNYKPIIGFFDSEWVGLRYFHQFFSSIYCWRIIKNTLLLSLYSILWGFPAPIILALLINEVRSKVFKKTIQTITYIPHFISMVVVVGLLKDLTITSGLINTIRELMGFSREPLLQIPSYFRTLFIGSDIWQQIGWGSIIYLAALSGIDEQLYEAARIDGANRWKQTLHVTLPGIQPTIIILLILRIGKMLNIGFEKIILMYNPSIYETADVISTHVYRIGLLDNNFSYAAAIGLFNAIINLILLVSANQLSKKYSDTSLW